LTSTYGLGVDQVLEYQVITADGQYVIANPVVNPDLFWALRGGGGTFGIVTQATVKAYPSPRIAVASWWINSTESGFHRYIRRANTTYRPGPGNATGIRKKNPEAIFEPAAFLLSKLPHLNEEGVQGYFTLHPTAIQGIFLVAGDDVSPSNLKSLLNPTLDALESYPHMGQVIVEHTVYPTYKAFFDSAFGPLNSKQYEIEDKCKKDLDWTQLDFDCIYGLGNGNDEPMLKGRYLSRALSRRRPNDGVPGSRDIKDPVRQFQFLGI
jgi:hypothetical protein